MRWAGHVARMGEKMFLLENPEEKRPLGSPSRRWEDSIKSNFRKIR
jgi:hypothetical protein